MKKDTATIFYGLLSKSETKTKMSNNPIITVTVCRPAMLLK